MFDSNGGNLSRRSTRFYARAYTMVIIIALALSRLISRSPMADITQSPFNRNGKEQTDREKRRDRGTLFVHYYNVSDGDSNFAMSSIDNIIRVCTTISQRRR